MQRPEASLNGSSKPGRLPGHTSLAGVQEGWIPTTEGEVGIDISPQDMCPLCAAEGNSHGFWPRNDLGPKAFLIPWSMWNGVQLPSRAPWDRSQDAT
jgi:hypothetical protein